MISSSSSSSSSSDDSDIFLLSSSEDELEAILLREKPTKHDNYIENIIPNYSNDKDFVKYFRVNRNVANDLAYKFEMSGYFHYQSGGHGKIGSLQEILIYLWFLAHQTTPFRDIADRFYISISTLHRIIRKVTLFLSNLLKETITWPATDEKEIIERHFRFNNFPGVIGCIGCTHIKIAKPGNDPESYLNKNKFYSIQLQVVCDHKKRIRDIFVGFPGSVSNSYVFQSSPLYANLKEKCVEYYLLGNKSYPCLENLLTPFEDNGCLNEKQKNFNMKLSLNQFVVEQCFTMLRQKFRQLNYLKLKNMDDIVHLIRACCVLHNLTLEDEFDFEEMEFIGNIRSSCEDTWSDFKGQEKRNHIANILNDLISKT